MRPHHRLVHGLFAGLDCGMLHLRLRTTRSAFGSTEPNRRQILVGVVARADLPAMDVGAQRHQPVPPKRVDIVRYQFRLRSRANLRSPSRSAVGGYAISIRQNPLRKHKNLALFSFHLAAGSA